MPAFDVSGSPFGWQEKINPFGPGSVWQRYLQTAPQMSQYGQYSPQVQDYLMQQGPDQYYRYMLDQARNARMSTGAAGSDFGRDFTSYLGTSGASDAASARSGLQQLAGILQTPAEQRNQNQMAVGEWGSQVDSNGIPFHLVNAALQPGLQTVAPGLQGYLSNAMNRQAGSYFANNPGNTSGFLDYLRARGFY